VRATLKTVVAYCVLHLLPLLHTHTHKSSIGVYVSLFFLYGSHCFFRVSIVYLLRYIPIMLEGIYVHVCDVCLSMKTFFVLFEIAQIHIPY
jgi:hypothetical protein